MQHPQHQHHHYPLHFIRLRRYWYVLSLLVIIPGVISLFTQGLNKGIDFTGGNILDLKFHKSVKGAAIREVLADFDLAKSRIQQSGPRSFIIRTRTLKATENAEVLRALEERHGGVTVRRNDHVGPIIAEELGGKALLALVVACALMLLYITIRFEFLQGVAAVGALIHDGLVVLGVFSFFRIEKMQLTL